MNCVYVLSDSKNFSRKINGPLRDAQRVRYTCLDCSKNYLVLGATSGSFYIFGREPCEFLYFLPSKYGAITCIQISPQENLVAFATVKRTICYFPLTISSAPTQNAVTVAVFDAGETVTCMHWTLDERQLFFGNKKGTVALINLTYFMTRTMIHPTVHPILLLDSKIVQIDCCKDLLLVSTTTKSILCNTDTEQFKQIGNRPRDGIYGACFVRNETATRIYCARPGLRLWEVNGDGLVLQTHQYKQALSVAPSRVLDNCSVAKREYILNLINNGTAPVQSARHHPEPIDYPTQFSRLIPFERRFLCSYSSNHFCIIDPVQSSVLLWNDQYTDITSVHVVGEHIILFMGGQCAVVQLRVQLVEAYALDLFRREKYIECGILLKAHREYMVTRINESTQYAELRHLKEILADFEQRHLIEELADFFEAIASDQIDECVRILPSNVPGNGGVYILGGGGKPATENLRSTLVSVVTGKFGLRSKFSDVFKKGDLPPIVDLRKMAKQLPEAVVDCDDEEIVPIPRSVREPARDTKLTDEQKVVHNLFLIQKSSKFSSVSFLDRYAPIFDAYTAPEIEQLLRALEECMIENGDTLAEAQDNCLALYFDYLQLDTIEAMSDESLQFIMTGFIKVNRSFRTPACASCKGFMIASNRCVYPALGTALFQMWLSRQAHEECDRLTQSVAHILRVAGQSALENPAAVRPVQTAMVAGSEELFRRVAGNFDQTGWEEAFEFLYLLVNEQTVKCVHCGHLNVGYRETDAVEIGPFYSWSRFLELAMEHLDGVETLHLLAKYLKHIPKGCLTTDFYLRCLLSP